MEQEIRDCLKQFSNAWGDNNVQALAECMTDSVVYSASIGPDFGETWRGKQNVLNGIAKMINRDNAVGEVSEPTICGNTAFHTWIYKSKETGEIIAKGCDIFHFQDGSIALKDAYRKVTSPG